MYGAMCVYGQNKKDALWLIILSIQIYFLSFPPPSSFFFFFFKENDTAELGGEAWVWCMVFEILMPRQKANTSHSLIIKYSHYSFFLKTVFFLTKRDMQGSPSDILKLDQVLYQTKSRGSELKWAERHTFTLKATGGSVVPSCPQP